MRASVRACFCHSIESVKNEQLVAKRILSLGKQSINVWRIAEGGTIFPAMLFNVKRKHQGEAERQSIERSRKHP